MLKPEETNQLIRNRRSIFPPMFSDEPIDISIIEQMLENANWAPNHRLTEPWRFKVLRGDAKIRLGQFLADWYKENTSTEKYSEMKYKKTLKKAAISDTIIVICMQRDPAESLPEWEEIAAVACAVQNLWLTATAYGLGGYWSSPGSIRSMGAFLPLEKGERCLGLFYLGNVKEDVNVEGKRASAEDKITWLNE